LALDPESSPAAKSGLPDLAIFMLILATAEIRRARPEKRCPLPMSEANGERVGVRGLAAMVQITQPLTLTLSPQAGRGGHARIAPLDRRGRRSQVSSQPPGRIIDGFAVKRPHKTADDAKEVPNREHNQDDDAYSHKAREQPDQAADQADPESTNCRGRMRFERCARQVLRLM